MKSRIYTAEIWFKHERFSQVRGKKSVNSLLVNEKNSLLVCEKAHTMKVKVIDMEIENQWFILRIIGVPWRQKQKQSGWKPWSKENYMELGEGRGRCRLIRFLTFQSKAMLRDQHPTVCWRKLILACEGWFLNLQKFYELVIKCSHY